MTTETVEIHWQKITPSPLNEVVRGKVDPKSADIQGLADSILAHGVIQALVVYEDQSLPGFYRLIAGERRYWAARLLGEEAPLLPCQLRSAPASDLEALILMGTENLQREDLSPTAEGRYYRELLQRGLDIPSIVRATKKTRWRIQRAIDLVDLPEEIQRQIDSYTFPLTAVKYLKRLPSGELQIEVVQKTTGLTIEQIEATIDQVAAALRAREQNGHGNQNGGGENGRMAKSGKGGARDRKSQEVAKKRGRPKVEKAQKADLRIVQVLTTQLVSNLHKDAILLRLCADALAQADVVGLAELAFERAEEIGRAINKASNREAVMKGGQRVWRKR